MQIVSISFCKNAWQNKQKKTKNIIAQKFLQAKSSWGWGDSIPSLYLAANKDNTNPSIDIRDFKPAYL